MKKRVKFLIIGAGPTGLGAAYKLHELKENDFIILEKTSKIGGLSASYLDNQGFTWDVGGHVQFSHYKYFDRAMEMALGKDGWLNHQRESWVWIMNRFVPYPFQNNIHRLPRQEMEECLNGLIESAKNRKHPNNFEEWILQNFGKGIAKYFMLPYNHKVWAHSPKELDHNWISERVSTVNIEEIKKSIKNKTDNISWGPNNTFQFPKFGGTGSIWESIATIIDQNKILKNINIQSINHTDKIIHLKGGEKIQYKYLLSTIPLTLITQLIEGFPKILQSRAQELKYSSSNIFGVGLQGQLPQNLSKKCWMYFPEENIPFYRVTIFSNYSPHNVPDHKTQYSLMAEVSESSQKRTDSSHLEQNVTDGLYNANLIAKNHKIISQWKMRAEYGYPTPSIERDSILQEIMPELEKRGIYSRGRFGSWKYEIGNQDHSFMQGVEWVSRILLNQKEETFLVGNR